MVNAASPRWESAWNRGWDSTMHVLSLLRELGLDPASDEARRAVGMVRYGVSWRGCGPEEAEDNPFFAGEIESCINGQVAAAGAYFGQDVSGIVDRLLTEQLPDGGWNCEAAPTALRGLRSTPRSARSNEEVGAVVLETNGSFSVIRSVVRRRH